jgi:PKD repeat protein
VEFDGSSSSDPDGNVKSYKWDLGDGNQEKGKTSDYTYEEPGTYTLTLKVTDNEDAKASNETTVVIVEGNVSPVADAGGPYQGSVGDQVEFDGTDSNDPDGNIRSYEWDFGDGGSESGEKPDYKYEEPGTYTVTLTVEDNNGAKTSDETTAVIDN